MRKELKTCKSFTFEVDFVIRKETHLAWCVPKSRPQIKNECSVQNAQRGYILTVEGKICDMCSLHKP